jgi:hypothetical protein
VQTLRFAHLLTHRFAGSRTAVAEPRWRLLPVSKAKLMLQSTFPCSRGPWLAGGAGTPLPSMRMGFTGSRQGPCSGRRSGRTRPRSRSTFSGRRRERRGWRRSPKSLQTAARSGRSCWSPRRSLSTGNQCTRAQMAVRWSLSERFSAVAGSSWRAESAASRITLREKQRTCARPTPSPQLLLPTSWCVNAR